MTDVLKIGKKALTVSVVFTTILWSIGFAALVAPLVVKADVALVAGDVIQGTSTKNVFYYSADGKRYTFPTDKVFFSWFKDWTVVKKIPDAQMGNITIGGTIAYKAGTQLVKIQTDPKVYAVETGGTIRWVETEAIAKSLYGNDWAKKVHDVDPTIFPYVYKVGSSVNTASYPVGALVKVGSDYFYVNAANSKQKVSADVLAANGFQTKFAVVAANLDGYTAGTDMATEVALKTVAGTGSAAGTGTGTGTTVVPAGSGLTVALAADQPAAATIVSDSGTDVGAQAMIPVLKLNFTAPADGDVVVKSVVLKRGGISADADMGNVYLFDGETKLAGSPTIAATLVTFSNSSGLFTVTKGTTKTVTVKLDLKNNTAAGKTISFAVNAATDVTLASGAVSGTFPLAGNTFTTALITDLGKLAFANVTPAAAGTVDPGTAGFEFWRFSVTNSNQDVEIRKLNFTLVGSINVGDLKNFSLWAGATQIGSTAVDMASDKTITLDLASAPYVVTKGQVKNLSLKADIVSGTTRTFRASFQNSSDIVTYDKGYNVFLKANGLDSYTLVQPTDGTNAVNYTINSGSLTQTSATDSPTGNIPDGSTNVVLAKFSWKANGEDIKVSNLAVSSTASTATRVLANVRLLVNGSQVGTTDSSLTADGSSNTTSFGTFGNSFIIKAGTTAEVKVIGDTTASATAADDTFIVSLVVGSTNAQGTVSLTSISTVAQTANTLTVKGGQVTISKNAALGDKLSTNPTGPVNASGAKVASFMITAGSGESVDVSQISLTDTVVGTAYLGTYMQNITLKSAVGTQLGTTYANPSATAANTITFNISPAITIAAGAQYVVDVFADLKASMTTASTALINVGSAGVVATGHDTGTSATSASGAVALQYQYISGSGAFLLALDADSPVANNYLLGATDQTIAKFKITASSTEAVNITKLVVSGFFPTSASTGTWSNIRLYDNETNAPIGSAIASFGTAGITVTSTFAHAVFSNLTLNIPKGVAKVIVVKADAATFEALGLATTGQAPAIAVMRSYYGVSGNNPITATGASSGSSLTAVIDQTGSNWASGNTWSPGAYAATTTVYRVKLTTAWATDTPSGASSPGSAQIIGKFVITNLANAGSYMATVNFVNFDMSTTISTNAGVTDPRTLTIYKDSLATTALGSSNYLATEKFGRSRFSSWTTTVDIGSGTSKTFYATLDTTDAVTTENLSVRIGNSYVNWTDGVSTALTAMGADLPLVYKTLTY